MLSETTALGANALLIFIAIAVHGVLAVPQVGLGHLLSSRDEARPLTGASARLERGVINATIGYALYAPALLVVIATGASTATTLLAANLYLWARVAYFILYGIGGGGPRTLVWVVGVLATVWLWILVL